MALTVDLSTSQSEGASVIGRAHWLIAWSMFFAGHSEVIYLTEPSFRRRVSASGKVPTKWCGNARVDKSMLSVHDRMVIQK